MRASLLRATVAALALSTLSSCGYTWGIEHAPLISGPGPHSSWLGVGPASAPYDVDLHLPPRRFRSAGLIPFVIVLHGSGGTGPGMERRTRFSELADSIGFAVAYPNAHKSAQGRRVWSGEGPAAPDQAMLRALIDSVGARVALDRERIYLTGFSNGGGLAYRAAQAQPGVFAAIGVVAGAAGVSALAARAQPTPLIAVHGMMDETVRFDGAGRGASTPLTVRAWAQRNGCDADGRADTLGAGEFIRTSYEHCQMGANAVLYAMVHGGHGWPNVGTREAPFATTVTIWEFFRHHTLH